MVQHLAPVSPASPTLGDSSFNCSSLLIFSRPGAKTQTEAHLLHIRIFKSYKPSWQAVKIYSLLLPWEIYLDSWVQGWNSGTPCSSKRERDPLGEPAPAPAPHRLLFLNTSFLELPSTLPWLHIYTCGHPSPIPAPSTTLQTATAGPSLRPRCAHAYQWHSPGNVLGTKDSAENFESNAWSRQRDKL